MKYAAQDELVLALFPASKDLAFVYFEAPLSPIDWGLKHLRSKDKNAQALAIVERLCNAMRPDVVVIEECVLSKSRRDPRIKRLYSLIAIYAHTENIPLACYSRKTVMKTLSESGAVTKRQIAQMIASNIPAFARHLPGPRKPWNAEDRRLALFDAAALALTYFAFVPSSEEPP
ncbi:MAG: hypothetical protein KIT25_03715 [Enhydrobacter sp.]|nr:MAG: hypothetical protein KIT25_03715 [Enhydrobacter sp.]